MKGKIKCKQKSDANRSQQSNKKTIKRKPKRKPNKKEIPNLQRNTSIQIELHID